MTDREAATRYRLNIEGVVQGVGFRPFVKRLADRFLLMGTVFNTGAGVTIEIETSAAERAHEFMKVLRAEAPAASRIEQFVVDEMPAAVGYRDFSIAPSAPLPGHFTLVSVDLATCPECLAEICDPAGRRYGYAFTNCTNCGPRYSITTSVPYDRANTTMRIFEMCPECSAEYADPSDRRFHAEPIACPLCGPRLSTDLAAAVKALESGAIVAIKSLGGFQLCCDALSHAALERLRLRKHRSRKPFALMMREMATIERYCHLDAEAREVLAGSSAPIVLLRLRAPGDLPELVAPSLNEAGVMLPYTPLHHLIFAHSSLDCLVMTSANLSEEPIVISNEEAGRRLPALADCIVAHDRGIFMRADDSVVRVVEGIPRVLRRARGYAPEAIALPFDAPEVIAAGAELKNTFCITKGRYAILSQHIGDLENAETLAFFEEAMANLSSVYRAEPKVVAHDLHPDYLSTRWALNRAEPKIAVQHHHAHVASCMAENGLRVPVIGVAFDGTGYGTDGQIWGGEFLLGTYRDFERAAHFRYVPLIGGDRAAREPWRMAAAHLFDALGPACFDLDLPCWRAAPDSSWRVLERLLHRPTLLTSSCGRLFDAIASICGVCQSNTYEGEAAILLEAAAGPPDGRSYPFLISGEAYPWSVDLRQMVSALTEDIRSGTTADVIARALHLTIAKIVLEVCGSLRERTGLNQICLSGGTFQNATLLVSCCRLLRHAGFEVATHSKAPPNDGGISLGQAAVAAARLREGT